MQWRKFAADALVVTVGCFLMALSVGLFFDPCNIIPGGVTGLAMILHDWTKIPSIGIYILLINAPLFVLSWIFVGRRFVLGTLFGTVVSSVLMDVVGKYIDPPQSEPLTAAIFGGLLMGFGLGLVFLRGVTTGGSDVAARLVKLLFPHMQIGHVMMAIDVAVVGLAGLYFQSINSMLYATIAIYIASVVVNTVLYGTNIERVAYIISEHPETVVAAIDDHLQRGATLLHGEGSFRGQPRKVILCAIKRQQSAQLKHIIKKADPNAFVILMSANEVLGEGFQDYNEHKL